MRSTRSFRLFATAVLTFLSTSIASSQDIPQWAGTLPEGYIRETATKVVMPIYPQEAVERRKYYRLRVKIAIDERGTVVAIRVKPGTPEFFTKAIADAVKQWKFEPAPDGFALGKNTLSRLTFSFSVQKGVGLVELYNPPLDAKDSQRLGYDNSNKEMAEWNIWVDVPIKEQGTNP